MKFFKGLYKSIYHLGTPDLLNEQWRINPVTLSFTGESKKYEKEFLLNYTDNSIKPIRFSLISAFVFFGIFAFLDQLQIPDSTNYTYIIRFGIFLPLIVSIIFITYSRFFAKNMQLFIASFILVAGAAVLTMVIFGSKTVLGYNYYVSLILVLVYTYAFFRGRFIYMSIAGWILVLAYQVVTYWFTDIPSNVIASNNFYLISANVIGMFVCYMLEYLVRKDFYLRKLLEQEKNRVSIANNELERRVEERTKMLMTTNETLKLEIEKRLQEQKEKMRIEAQLLQLQKMETIGTLAGGIAHDFNNILTPILGFSEIIKNEIPDNHEHKEGIHYIYDAAVKGKDLIEQILIFSRKKNSNYGAVSLNSIIKEALKLIKASIPSNIDIISNINECPSVFADPIQMHQVIMNVCTNAYQAMLKEGGTLTVNLDMVKLSGRNIDYENNPIEGNYIQLKISDTGAGMDLKTQSRIFEPFFTTKEVGGGSGLGLSVVHGIIKNSLGHIKVKSEPGNGTAFTILLPPYRSKINADTTQTAPLHVAKETNILFVDDAPEIAQLGKIMLNNLGYNADIETNPQRAYERVKRKEKIYDLLITDYSMPKMTGIDLIKSISEVSPNTRSIVLTGYSDQFLSQTSSIPKDLQILQKPIIQSVLNDAINKALVATPKVV